MQIKFKYEQELQSTLMLSIKDILAKLMTLWNQTAKVKCLISIISTKVLLLTAKKMVFVFTFFRIK